LYAPNSCEEKKKLLIFKDNGWEKLTDAVIRWISVHCSGVVFLLWGAYAHKKAACVDGSRHHLLKTVHPSPLSAHRQSCVIRNGLFFIRFLPCRNFRFRF
jgi:uracil DNA glycosylase